MGPLVRLVTIGALVVTLLCTVQGTKVKKRILLDRTPLLPDKVRLLAECSGANCTRTCPENYAIDSRQQYCRPKRQDSCPPGYVQRVGGGGGCTLEDIHCPPGSTREGHRCVIRSYSCPAGYVSRGNSCVRDNICQPGFRWENGLCFPGAARIFCPPGFTEQRNGNCAPAACSDCCDCQDETVGTVCPAGYANQWGRCVRVLQASPDLRIHSVMYKLPVECRGGETFNDGRCETWSTVGRATCRSGHPYNGSCVEVAKCQRGSLNSVCSCEFEQHLAATCAIGKLQEHGSGACVVSKVHCRAPGRLRNGVCVRESKARTTCPEGVPYQKDYCALDVPRCPKGFTVDEHGLCKRTTPCRIDCGPYQKLHRWCGMPASCPEAYTLNEHGYCVKESIHSAYSCPAGTTERGEECVSATPLCRSGFRYDSGVDLCSRCDERPFQCTRGNLTGGRCVWSEPACPPTYDWTDGMCVKNGTRQYRCKKGYEYENLCVHGELGCPTGYELLGESCVVKEDVHCPDGSYALEGRCTVAKECPEHFQSGPEACVREERRLINSTQPTCPAGFEYDGSVCIRRSVVEATVSRRDTVCLEGYERRSGGCVRTVRTFPVCPPRTIYTDRNDRCYCEVDLMCPPGYERTGTDCTFRSVGYTPFVHFLNPCYGSFCGNMHCISQCPSPPCPIEPCTDGAASISSIGRPGYGPARCLTDDCPPQEVVGLVCPPGYERVNSSCLAYYDQRCPPGYEQDSDGDGCTHELVLSPVCPPGYTGAGAGCLQASCPSGYKLTGTTCEKRELRSPKACPPGWDYFRGACYRRALCRNGTIDGAFCVEREFTRPTCPDGFVQREEDCAREGSCRPDSIYIDGVCMRFTEPTDCPAGTYRLGKLCVYPDPPECEDTPFVTTDCTSEVDSSGQCRRSASPSCAQGYRLRDDRCVACQTERTSCPPHQAIRHDICVSERVVCREGHFLRNGYCVMLHVARPRCPSEDYGLCGGFCIVPHAHDCKASEYRAPVCARGFQHRGKCVQHGRCDPEYTLLGGECHLRSFTDPSCHGKGTRVGELCVGGAPQCPPNYALMDGRCYSCLMENAACPGGASCSDSFCHLDTPRCTTSGAVFDGHVCRQLTASEPSCPTGTSPDRHDEHFCQLKSEKAVYNCPPEYHYQNGVCLKKLYKTPSCPPGEYKLRHGACVKRVCTRLSSGSVCSDGPSPAITCTQCLNGTTSSTMLNDQSSIHTLNGTIDLCCSVFSPRICQASGGCHHERETVCGSFCFTEDDKVYLTVPHSRQIGARLYVAPRRSDEDGNSYDDTTDPPEDCSQCIRGAASCPEECNTYDCQEEDDDECNFTDSYTFCAQYSGVNICARMLLT